MGINRRNIDIFPSGIAGKILRFISPVMVLIKAVFYPGVAIGNTPINGKYFLVSRNINFEVNAVEFYGNYIFEILLLLSVLYFVGRLIYLEYIKQ